MRSCAAKSCLLLLGASCGPAPTFQGQVQAAPTSEAASVTLDAVPVVSHAPPLVAVLDPAALALLSQHGFSLGELAVGVKAESTADLSRTPGMKSLFDELARDVNEAARAQPPARVTSSDGFRIFDVGWLDSSEMNFQLMGVFNRLDRRAFHPDSCGEVRFIYRLAYRTEHGGQTMASRLPLMLNVVYFLTAASCAEAAQAWQAPRDANGAELSSWLVERGPLTPAWRERWKLKSIEANLQRLRVQSFAHETLAGHIEYGLFVFHSMNEARTSFSLAPMENMPDVALLRRDPKLKAELLAHLKEPGVLRAIDEGTMRLPDRFLAKKATSVSPRGLSRLQNRPFRRLFTPAELESVELSTRSTIGSGAALLRRLDGATCVGCHQSRAIAGFHFVGDDDPAELAGAALFSGLSPHLSSELSRRREYVADVAAGRAPSEVRPIPERQGVGRGFGAPCGLGDVGFSDWTCAEGLHCEKLEDTEVGICTAAPGLASPCEFGRVLDHERPHKDYVTDVRRAGCGPQLSCHKNKSGFPLGACEGPCRTASADGACADFVDTDALQACLRLGKAYPACNQSSMIGVGMRACDDARPCRQDYVCARTKNEKAGACVPPYFVFPLRLDGYPLTR